MTSRSSTSSSRGKAIVVLLATLPVVVLQVTPVRVALQAMPHSLQPAAAAAAASCSQHLQQLPAQVWGLAVLGARELPTAASRPALLHSSQRNHHQCSSSSSSR